MSLLPQVEYGPAWPRRRLRSNNFVPLLLYLALSAACFVRTLNWSEYYFGFSTDSISFIWFLNWWPYAISHGLNPFICKYVWFPSGYNFTWATSVPTLALLTWPITVLGSPILSYNILMLTAPAFAAWTAFLLGRELTGNFAASLICGYLFGFSALELLELLGELNLAIIFLVPLAILLCVRRMRGSLRRRTFIAGLSLTLLAQLGISTEILATLCLLGAVTWLVFLATTPAGERTPYWRLAADIAMAAPIVALLAAPFLYYLFIGLPDVPANIFPADIGASELLQFLFPVVPVTSAGAELVGILKEFFGFSPDNISFIGIPLLIILVCYFYREIDKPNVKALLIVICGIVVLSLGAVLRFDGAFIEIPMPWKLFSHVPVIRSIMPFRLQLYLTIATAITAALWLSNATSFVARLRRFALAGVACLFLLPTKVQLISAQPAIEVPFAPQTAFSWTRWPVHPFFTPEHIRRMLGLQPNVLLLPDTELGPGMAWQLDSRMAFTQSEGYVGFRPASQKDWQFLDELDIAPPKLDFFRMFSAYCAAKKVTYILIGPGTPPAIIAAVEHLGWPHQLDHGIEIVKTPTGPG